MPHIRGDPRAGHPTEEERRIMEARAGQVPARPGTQAPSASDPWGLFGLQIAADNPFLEFMRTPLPGVGIRPEQQFDPILTALRYFARATETIGLPISSVIPMTGALGPRSFMEAPGEQIKAFKAFLEPAMRGDWDAAIHAYQDEITPTLPWQDPDSKIPFYHGLSQIPAAFVPTGGPALLGAKVVSSAPTIARTVAKLAPAAARPAVYRGVSQGVQPVGKAMMAPWQLENLAGEMAIRGGIKGVKGVGRGVGWLGGRARRGAAEAAVRVPGGGELGLKIAGVKPIAGEAGTPFYREARENVIEKFTDPNLQTQFLDMQNQFTDMGLGFDAVSVGQRGDEFFLSVSRPRIKAKINEAIDKTSNDPGIGEGVRHWIRTSDFGGRSSEYTVGSGSKVLEYSGIKGRGAGLPIRSNNLYFNNFDDLRNWLRKGEYKAPEIRGTTLRPGEVVKPLYELEKATQRRPSWILPPQRSIRKTKYDEERMGKVQKDIEEYNLQQEGVEEVPIEIVDDDTPVSVIQARDLVPPTDPPTVPITRAIDVEEVGVNLTSEVEAVHTKLSNYKRPNSTNANKELDTLKDKGIEVDDARDSIEAYKDIDRAEYDDADDYAEAKSEAWNAVLESIENLDAEAVTPTVPPTETPVVEAARVSIPNKMLRDGQKLSQYMWRTGRKSGRSRYKYPENILTLQEVRRTLRDEMKAYADVSSIIPNFKNYYGSSDDFSSWATKAGLSNVDSQYARDALWLYEGKRLGFNPDDLVRKYPDAFPTMKVTAQVPEVPPTVPATQAAEEVITTPSPIVQATVDEGIPGLRGKYDMTWKTFVKETKFKYKIHRKSETAPAVWESASSFFLESPEDVVFIKYGNSSQSGINEEILKRKIIRDHIARDFYTPPRIDTPSWVKNTDDPFPKVPKGEIDFYDVPGWYQSKKYNDALLDKKLAGSSLAKKLVRYAGETTVEIRTSGSFMGTIGQSQKLTDIWDTGVNVAELISRKLMVSIGDITNKKLEAVRKVFKNATEASLIHRGLPEKFYVFRGGATKGTKDTPTSVTLDPDIAAKWFGQGSQGTPDVRMYEVNRSDILLDVDSVLWGDTTVDRFTGAAAREMWQHQEQELIVRIGSLKNSRKVNLPRTKDFIGEERAIEESIKIDEAVPTTSTRVVKEVTEEAIATPTPVVEAAEKVIPEVDVATKTGPDVLEVNLGKISEEEAQDLVDKYATWENLVDDFGRASSENVNPDKATPTRIGAGDPPSVGTGGIPGEGLPVNSSGNNTLPPSPTLGFLIENMFREDVWRRIANLPIMKQFLQNSPWFSNPAGVANSPADKFLVLRSTYRYYADQKAELLIARVKQLGSEESIWGKMDDTGKLTEGPFAGMFLNDIRTQRYKFENRMTPEMKTWINSMEELEAAKLQYLKDNNIPIHELKFEEGGVYAGRRVVGKIGRDGKVNDTGIIGKRPGAKLSSERQRWYTTQEEAVGKGFRYMSETNALYLNIKGAYRRVDDQNLVEWFLNQPGISYRHISTSFGVPEFNIAHKAELRRLNAAILIKKQIKHAIGGERITGHQIRGIKKYFPEEAERLKQLSADMQAGKETAPEVKSLQADVELLIKNRKAMEKDAEVELLKAKGRAAKVQQGEYTVSAPAFNDIIFTGDDAFNLSSALNKQFAGDYNAVLASVNKVNALLRFFQLSGDASPFGIHLIFMAGRPDIYLRSGVAFVKALFDPTFASKQKRNIPQELLDKHPGIQWVSGGGNEITEALGTGGLLMEKPFKLLGVPLQPFARGFESALDTAGIELMKSLDRYATTSQRAYQVDDFINKFRGLARSDRLGVTETNRAIENATFLASSYNRSIAALFFDVFHGGLSGHLARVNLARGLTAVSAMTVVVGYSMGDSTKQVIDRLNPRSPNFMTWNIGGTRIGPGSKARSVIKLLADTSKDPGSLMEKSMENPGLRFLRGNLAPVASDGLDILVGSTYIGDPIDTPAAFGKEILAPALMPIWVQSTVLEGGTFGERLTRGGVEFLGGRAYPASPLRETARKKYGMDYNDLEYYQKDEVREDEEVQEYFREQENKTGVKNRYFSHINAYDAEHIAKMNSYVSDYRGDKNAIRNAYYSNLQFYRGAKDAVKRALEPGFKEPDIDDKDLGERALAERFELFDNPRIKSSTGNIIWDNYDAALSRLEAKWARQTRIDPQTGQRESVLYYVRRNTNLTPVPSGLLPYLAESTRTNIYRSKAARIKHQRDIAPAPQPVKETERRVTFPFGKDLEPMESYINFTVPPRGTVPVGR